MIPYRYIERSKYYFVPIPTCSFYCSYLFVFRRKFFIKHYLSAFFFFEIDIQQLYAKIPWELKLNEKKI